MHRNATEPGRGTLSIALVVDDGYGATALGLGFSTMTGRSWPLRLYLRASVCDLEARSSREPCFGESNVAGLAIGSLNTKLHPL